MLPGFLPGSRATLMLDVVAVAMLFILPALAWSIYLVRVRKNYLLHRRIQLSLGITLLLAVILFEVDMRLVGWRQLAESSPFAQASLFSRMPHLSQLDLMLWVHLFFAIAAFVAWTITILEALRRFPSPPKPSDYSARHRRLAWLATVLMAGTSLTGWTFYYMAFVAV